ncbi:type IV toxin-antitoxin system AbiEi family antitoxin domain-containing protein [Caballeronia novacaledonica]|nr:DUF6088 family protein [Caballeronia sp. LZ029]MDR5746761.1 DUF6088 family protein [Caballeronia sp. LZ029]GJH12622.1 type IV toxin-antitoxin system AbiEi family antitoxin domain-containing protein [Caballeronia novacaledonica]
MTVASLGGKSRERRRQQMTTLDRVARFLAHSDVVILRAEVAHLGSGAQVGRVLARLVREKKLIRVSMGVYAKTRVNSFTGALTPAATFEEIAADTFRKLGVDVSVGRAAREYNSGKTTQVPVQPVVNTGRRRITRRIAVGSRAVIYERGFSDD